MATCRAACHRSRHLKPTLSASLLLALLLLAGDCHCHTPLVSTSEVCTCRVYVVQLASPAHLELQRGASHEAIACLLLQAIKGPLRLQSNAILHQHRKLQQHVYDLSGADLDAKGQTDLQPRLQHHRQARNAAVSTDQSKQSHIHTSEPGNSQLSRQQQHSVVLGSDTHAALNDTKTSHLTQKDTAMEQVLYPNSPQWRQNDTQWHHVHESYAEQLASGQVGTRHA